MEQVLLDQQTLAKQMESTVNAVAQLTINQMRSRQDRSPSPASSDSTDEIAFRQSNTHILGVQFHSLAVMVLHHTEHTTRTELDRVNNIILGITHLRCSFPLSQAPTQVSGGTNVRTISESSIYQKDCGAHMLHYIWMIKLQNGSRSIN